MRRPSLPPVYALEVVATGARPFAHACHLATEHSGDLDGTVVWRESGLRMDAAFLLDLDDQETADEAVETMLVALADALGSLLPPTVPLQVRLPASLILDGAELCTLRAHPCRDRLVLGIDLPVARQSVEMSLEEVGGGDIEVAALLEAVARHFLHWVARRREDGPDPLRASLRSRLAAGVAP